jgi:hypothetical protein
MQWYLKHFPTTASFLASGALMTGEASPGYLPYPDVVNKVRERLPESRIIAVGREPIDRAFSSYRFNYVHPTLASMKHGQVEGIKKNQSDEFYEKFLFSFEDMVKAELKVLRKCFASNGPGIVGARKKYGSKEWIKPEFERREKLGEPPLVDLDGYCYGGVVSADVPRKQWAELIAAHPEKIILNQNLQLVQAMIGRGLHTFPLEWWYATFPHSQVFFLCTEELSDMSGHPMNQLGSFLGLPEHNFSSIVMKGAYNVGGHKGYDNEVPWSTVEEESSTVEMKSQGNEPKKEIPLSEEFRRELADFVQPYNERLFALTGRRCDW